MTSSPQQPSVSLPTWDHLSSSSDEALFKAFEDTPYRFPSPWLINPVSIRRIATDAVMRTTIPIPAVRRVLGADQMSGIIIDYIPGRTLAHCWPALTFWQRVRIIWIIRGYIRQLRRVRPTKAGSRALFPGPVANEPEECIGPMFTEYGAGPFASYEELTAWFMHKLDVNRRVTKYPPESQRMAFDSSLPLVLTHLDLHPNNVIVGDDGRVWLIDWETAGFYPQWFEYASMRAGWDILGRWKLIGWALNTGALL
ncbi:putative choline/ethanolamine kinase [Lyophyllum shimeji]|uniref:Choline/ethanolamine kinase n=1 Tax=Lyophyllum shimeji TaxID=47721 RepID=A0A9P3PIJ5_LYOSH|nr:putative choline/ethanolamine kinase [Lyophyllum shimeji]